MNEKINGLSDKKKALLALRLMKKNAQGNASFLIPKMPSVPGTRHFPMSFAQKRFWFMDQFLDDRSVNNTRMVFLLSGGLDKAALESAFEEILARHQVLGMCFRSHEDHPVMVPLDEAKLKIHYHTPRSFLKSKRENEIDRLIAAEVKIPIDIANELPLRVSVIKKTSREWVIVIVMHHIVADAWSFRILIRELQALYKARVTGEAVTLDPLPVQYHDYADWQNKRLTSSHIEDLTKYWKETLSGAPTLLNLTTDFPRPPVQTHNGANFNFVIPAETLVAVERVAREYRLTPFAVTFSAFALMLYRYTGQEDLLIGIPFENRNRQELQSLIGLFLNTLVLRTMIDGGDTVANLLERVKEKSLSAFSHSQLPFEKLIEDQRIERSLSHPVLFQVMFNYHSMTNLDFSSQEMKTKKMNTRVEYSKFDFELSIRYMKKRMRGTITYNTDLFTPQTITRMACHYSTILKNMLEDLQAPVARVRMLADNELAFVEPKRNLKRTPEESFPYLHRRFEEYAARIPDAIAVTCGYACLTYRELNERANRIAHYLIGRGVVPEVKIAVLMDRSVDLVTVIMGIMKAGAAFIPIEPDYPALRISHIVSDSEAPYLIADLAVPAETLLPAGIEVLVAKDLFAKSAGHSERNPEPFIELSSLLYILYTSGTTGKPKGVAVGHGNYIAYLEGIQEKMGLADGLNYAIISTFSADLGSVMMWGAFSSGGTLHVITYEESLDPEAVAKIFLKREIDVIKLVPSHFDALLKAKNPIHILPRALLLLAGEPCSWDTIDAIRKINRNQRIMINYGPTETTVSSHAYDVPEKRPVQHTSVLPIGYPLKNAISVILDPNGNCVPKGVPGELHIGGPVVSRGYVNQPGLTDKKFIVMNTERYYRTGDLVRYLENGEMEFLGRIDDQVKINGFRIELGEITGALAGHPAVGEAVTILKESGAGEKHLVCFVVPKPGSGPVDPEALLLFLKEKLPHYMIPRALAGIDRIPLTSNGKIDRAALLAIPVEIGLTVHEYAEPRDDLEMRMAAVWSEVLVMEKTGIDDNFFFMGGDSFKAIRMVNMLRKENCNLRVVDIFKYSTIRELSDFVKQGTTVTRGMLNELTPPRETGKGNLTFICIPYPAGDPVMYQPLADMLPEHCSLFAYEFPGRGSGEIQVSIAESAAACVAEIKQKAAGPVVVYGHCMGGAFATEVARLLEQDGVPVVALFLGAIFPATRLPGKFFSLWNKLFPNDRNRSDRELLDMMRRTGGITEDITKEEQEYLLAYMRFYSRESDQYYSDAFQEKEFRKLVAPIVSIVGDMDRLTNFYEERYLDWRFFSRTVHLEVIPEAGHFFHMHQTDQVLKLIDKYTGIVSTERAVPTDRLFPEAQAVIAAKSDVPGEKDAREDEALKMEEKKHIRSFLAVAFGRFVSMFGSSLSGFAMGIYVLGLKGSIMDFSLVLLFGRLPQILIMPVVGWIVDRYDRRKLMLFADCVSASRCVVLLILLATRSLELWHVFIASTVGSLSAAFRTNAYTASVAQLVPKRYLANANGFVQLTDNTGDILSPLLAGLLLAVISIQDIFVIDLLSFGVGFLPLLLVRFPNKMIRQIEEPIMKAIMGGYKFIARRKSMVIMVVFFFIANIFLGIGTTLLTPLVLSFSEPATLGLVTSVTGIGTLVGALVISLWGGFKRRATGMIGFNILFGLSYVVMGLYPNPVFPIVGVFMFRIALIMVVVHWQSIIQVKVGLELQGRVFAMNELLSRISIPIGIFLGGFLSEYVFNPFMSGSSDLARMVGSVIGTGPGRGIALLIILAGIMRALMGVIGLRIRSFRYMEDRLPDISHGASVIRDKDKYQKIIDREYEYTAQSGPRKD